MTEAGPLSDAVVVRRQGLWMFVSAVVNSGLGFVFWALAARAFSVDDVGVAGAVVTLGSLGTSIAMFGLDNSLVRYVSKVERPRLLIYRLAALSGLSALVVGIVLAVLVFGQGAASDPLTIIAVAVTLTVFQVWYQLTDSTLLAAERNELLAARSLIYGVTKIAAIFTVLSLGAAGILLSYTAPLILIVAIGFVLTHVLWPPLNPGGASYRVKDFATLSVGNYVSGLVWFLPNRLAPSLLLVFAGPESAAYFFLALTIAEVLNYIPESVGKSVFAHGSRRDGIPPDLMHNVRRWLTAIMVPLVLLGIVFSDFGLRIIGGHAHGADYAAHALALQLFLVAVLPRTGLQILKAQFNVEKRPSALIALGVSTGVSTILFLVVGLALRWEVDVLAVCWILGGFVGLVVGGRLAGWRFLPRRRTA